MPVSLDRVAHPSESAMPSSLEFTEADFEGAWAASLALLPSLADTKIDPEMPRIRR
jgi:hypothetical protein